MNEPHACTFNRDQRCLKGAGCAAHGIECMRRTAALSFTMDRTQDAADAARDGVEREARNEPTSSDVERMREALEWYGEQARLARLIHSEGDAGRHALAEDGGKRARAILAERSAARSEPSTAGWLPISTAPKDGTRILTKLDHPVTPVQIARWQHLEWRLDNNNWPCYPLGWQPLPPPSQEGASEGEGQT
jgi:hypothetical protein